MNRDTRRSSAGLSLRPALLAAGAAATLLAGCGDMSSAGAPMRDGAGRPIDPIYGTVEPGWSMGTGGGGGM